LTSISAISKTAPKKKMKILFDGKYQSIIKNDKIYIIIKVLFYIKELFQEIELKILK